MMECKFTDNEIVKALECCKNLNCFRCPFDGETDCVHKCAEVTLDLINRQKAEIQRLNFENLQMIASIKHLKSETIKEFAERVKDIVDEPALIRGRVIDVTIAKIDNLVKEMTGENNGN